MNVGRACPSWSGGGGCGCALRTSVIVWRMSGTRPLIIGTGSPTSATRSPATGIAATRTGTPGSTWCCAPRTRGIWRRICGTRRPGPVIWPPTIVTGRAGIVTMEDAAADCGRAEIDRDWSGRDRDESAGDRAAPVEARDRAATQREAAGEQRVEAAVDRFQAESDRTHAAKDREQSADDRHAAGNNDVDS
jgi:hypothetical protein